MRGDCFGLVFGVTVGVGKLGQLGFHEGFLVLANCS